MPYSMQNKSAHTKHLDLCISIAYPEKILVEEYGALNRIGSFWFRLKNFLEVVKYATADDYIL